jgi:RNase P subunit RPR2
MVATGVSAQAFRDYKDLKPSDIVQVETDLLGAYVRTILPQCGDRAAALEAVLYMVSERDMIALGMDRYFPLDQIEGITASDAVDDSLARGFFAISRAYAAAAGPASYADTTGALNLFHRRIEESPGVGGIPVPFSTFAAIRFGRDALAAARASGRNEAAADDAFLRYVGEITRRYMDARTTLRKRHQAEVRNEDWVLARLRCAECGAQDWDAGALFMKIKKGTSNYHHTRDLTCRKCGSVLTWDYLLPSYTIMNQLGTARLPGEPPDSTAPADSGPGTERQAE